jgi:hypothetical protein
LINHGAFKVSSLLKRYDARARLTRLARRIPTRQALELIKSRGLATVGESWHYSWDLERFFDDMLVFESGSNTYVFQTKPINEWSPAPLFSDDAGLKLAIAAEGKNCPFWLLKLTSFDDFLNRRSDLSRKPTANFPTRQTYPRYARKLNCELERRNLLGNEDLFSELYSKWKIEKYQQSGEEMLQIALNTNVRTPKEWFFIHLLKERDSNAYKGVSLMIEDDRSCSMLNIASELNHGTFMLVESVKECCKNKYSTFDTGVSGLYGNYKSLIYLDSIETDSTGCPAFVVREELGSH